MPKITMAPCCHALSVLTGIAARTQVPKNQIRTLPNFSPNLAATCDELRILGTLYATCATLRAGLPAAAGRFTAARYAVASAADRPLAFKRARINSPPGSMLSSAAPPHYADASAAYGRLSFIRAALRHE